MSIEWEIPERLKAGLIFYGGINMQGKRQTVRLGLRGRRGDPSGREMSSMVLRAPFGTTIVLMTDPGPDWEQGSWRAVRILEGVALPGKSAPLPGVRIPDLDVLDDPHAKKTSTGYVESFPLVKRFSDGTGWTFGHLADEELKGNVRGIMVLKGGAAAGEVPDERDEGPWARRVGVPSGGAVEVEMRDRGQVETVLATELGGDRYRLQATPFLAYGVSLGDVVEARGDDPALFRRVIEKSGNRTVRAVLKPPPAESAASQAVVDRLSEMGCDVHEANPGFIAVIVPRSADYDGVRRYLQSTGVRWEHADPSYAELYG